jgi:hypothetical protein
VFEVAPLHLTRPFWWQPCVCGETCGCGTVKVPKEDIIKGNALLMISLRSLVTAPAAIKASKATASAAGKA